MSYIMNWIIEVHFGPVSYDFECFLTAANGADSYNVSNPRAYVMSKQSGFCQIAYLYLIDPRGDNQSLNHLWIDSMTTRILELPGMQVQAITYEHNQVTVIFSTANVIKSMDDAVEKTLWRQAGKLIVTEAELAGAIPPLPAIVEHADINDNTYTQRDMIQIPLHSNGRVGCELKFRDHPERIVVWGEAIRLVLDDVPKYIRHMTANDTGL